MPLDAVIAKVEKRLDALEVKPSSPVALRELIARLDEKITAAQEKDTVLEVKPQRVCSFRAMRRRNHPRRDQKSRFYRPKSS